MAVQDYILVHVYDESHRSLLSIMDIHKVCTLLAAHIFNTIFYISSILTHNRGQEAIERYGLDTRKRAKRLRLYIYLCLCCVIASTFIVIMEAYALLALQFCDGEDLMSLYWSTWTMIQVGSLIAMVGIILALLHSLKDRKHP